MAYDPLDLTLNVVPRSRFDMVDLHGLVSARARRRPVGLPAVPVLVVAYPAGFLDRSVASRLLQKPGVAAYIDAFRAIFPEGANYEHDQLDRRTELAPEQRVISSPGTPIRTSRSSPPASGPA